jgi:hypothetical protein
VRKIFNMVESRCLNRQLPEQLKNKFRHRNPAVFFEALTLVEEFAEHHHIQLQKCIRPRNQPKPVDDMNNMARVSSQERIVNVVPPSFVKSTHSQQMSYQRGSQMGTPVGQRPPMVQSFVVRERSMSPQMSIPQRKSVIIHHSPQSSMHVSSFPPNEYQLEPPKPQQAHPMLFSFNAHPVNPIPQPVPPQPTTEEKEKQERSEVESHRQVERQLYPTSNE